MQTRKTPITYEIVQKIEGTDLLIVRESRSEGRSRTFVITDGFNPPKPVLILKEKLHNVFYNDKENFVKYYPPFALQIQEKRENDTNVLFILRGELEWWAENRDTLAAMVEELQKALENPHLEALLKAEFEGRFEMKYREIMEGN